MACHPCHHLTCHPHFHHHLPTPLPTQSATAVINLLSQKHPLTFASEQLSPILRFISSTSQQTSIVSSFRSTAATPSSLLTPPKQICSRRVFDLSLRYIYIYIFPYFFHYIYCTNIYLLDRLCMCTVTTKHITTGTTPRWIATSPPHHQHTQQQKGLEMYLEPMVGFFFLIFFLQY